MPLPNPSKRLRGALIVTSLLGLSLGACRDERLELAASPLGWPTVVDAPYPMAPPPYQGPAPIGQLVSYDDSYAWAERSYAMDDAFYGVQPDYGFHYDGAQPYVWETADDWAMYAEPYQDDYRFYYYEPGDHYPYFIRDADYGYGYDDFGRLVVVYDIYGRVMPASFLYERNGLAGDYYRRAHALRNVSYTTQHITITNNIWRVRQPKVRRAQTIWIEAASTHEDWRRYRARTGERDLRAFRTERRRDREPILTRVSRTLSAPLVEDERAPRDLLRAVHRDEERQRRRDAKVRREAEAEERRPAGVDRELRQRQKAEPAKDSGQVRTPPRREQQARVETERRREQAKARQAELRQQRENAEQAKARGKSEARAGREQPARAEAERREPVQARQAEQRRQRAKAEQAKPRNEARAADTERRREQARQAELRQKRDKAEQAKARVQVEAKARREQPARVKAERRPDQAAKGEARERAQKQAREQRAKAPQARQSTQASGEDGRARRDKAQKKG